MTFLSYESNNSTLERQSLRDQSYLGKKHRLYACSYENCSTSLKSKKLKVYHHDKVDLECRAEKTLLLALLQEFNKAVLEFSSSINIQKMTSSYAYKNVLRQYKFSRRRIINQEQLDAIFVDNDTFIK